MKKVAPWAIVIILLVFGAELALPLIGEVRALLGGWSFTKSVEVISPDQDRGYYYRLKVNLAYKGEPLDFDIVVGCRVRITTYKDNDRTVEVGVVPTVFGLKTKDEQGVAVHTQRLPVACVT
jgi:hypothetical protein